MSCCIVWKYLAKGHNGTDRLFLHPKDSFVESESVWYRKEPFGATTMSEFMKRLSRTAVLSTEYTNHCIRATTITLLNDSGFESRHIVTVSGHKNQASLTSYCYEQSLKIPTGQSKNHQSKDRQHHGQNKKTITQTMVYKTTHKTKDWVTRTPLKTGGELRSSGRVSSSCLF